MAIFIGEKILSVRRRWNGCPCDLPPVLPKAPRGHVRAACRGDDRAAAALRHAMQGALIPGRGGSAGRVHVVRTNEKRLRYHRLG
jgi:hypothetical protein